MAQLSGADWWHANEAQYPNSRDIDDLDEQFRPSVEAFVRALRAAGARISVAATRRDETRAFLMHYSWRIAYEKLDPSTVPNRAGLDIQWDHGDEQASRDAARQMAGLFGLKFKPALTSNHIRGLAIDMNITWRERLVLRRGDRVIATIEEGPRNGADNQQLHEAGADGFSVFKLKSDPPHWSINGR
jgi:hypothetical protein